jgi:cyclopropane fatty-acyl-phospholipid synthase-like methyltransferase
VSSTQRSYFDAVYENESDPWAFETSEYERRKYSVTLASLPKAHYGAVFEPGCSIGVLTEKLAARCDELLATDVVPTALQRATNRLRNCPHVTIERRAIPEEWPEGPFDLVVLSEIAYYFDEEDLTRIISLIIRSTTVGAHVIGVHWRGETDYPLSGDRTHELIDATPQLDRIVLHVEPEFTLAVWERR